MNYKGNVKSCLIRISQMLNIDLSFRELEIFCKVVELGSFSKAAQAVFSGTGIGK